MKPLEEWEYEDLLNYCAWQVLTGIAQGQKLVSIMASLHKLHVDWHLMIQERQKKAKK